MKKETKTTATAMFRQGDVLIVATQETDNLGKEVPMSEMGPILALGEVTGHHHTVLSNPESYDPVSDLPDYWPVDYEVSLRDWANRLLVKIEFDSMVEGPAARLYEENDNFRRLVVSRHTILRHEEHPAIALPPGHYKVIQQQEYSPKGWVRVQD